MYAQKVTFPFNYRQEMLRTKNCTNSYAFGAEDFLILLSSCDYYILYLFTVLYYGSFDVQNNS